MKIRLHYLLLPLLLIACIASAQPTGKQIKRINKFNRLFGDYFYVNDRMQILPQDGIAYDFNTFYYIVRTKNWGATFENNLNLDPVLGEHYGNVISMNLKLREGGILFPENFEKKTAAPEKKKSQEKDKLKTEAEKEKDKLEQEQEKKQKEQEKKLLTEREQQLKQEKLFLNDSLQKNYAQAQQNQKLNHDSLTIVMQKELGYYETSQALDPNGYKLSRFVKHISDEAAQHHAKHIFFFVHGYNVTQSLAQMQGNRLLDHIMKHYKNTDTILFVRVFWEGGNSKKLKVITQRGSYGKKLFKIKYRDKISPANATGFKKKKREAIACGYALRRLLTMLEKTEARDRKIHLISHSLGAAMVTNALVNDVTPIRYRRKAVLRIVRDMNDELDSCCLARIDSVLHRSGGCGKRRDQAREFISLMRSYRPPALKVDILLNAPAVSGVKLFRFADMSREYNFIVGYNLFDPTLAKRFFAKSTMLSGKLSGFAGDTRLGLNYNNEVGQTEFRLNQRFKAGSSHLSLKGYRSSNFFEHDIFFYMEHPLFTNVLNSYLKLN